MMKEGLLFVPGWSMETPVWEPLLPFLSGQFGRKFLEWKGVSTVSDYKNRMLAAIRGEKNPFYILCWSLGALATIDAVCTEESALKGIIIIGGTSCFSLINGNTSGWPGRVLERMRQRIFLDKEAVLKDFYHSMLSGPEKEDNPVLMQETVSRFAGDTAESLSAGLDYLCQMDLRRQLQLIKVPVLLIHGDLDPICPIESTVTIQHGLKTPVSFITINGAGHAPFITQPHMVGRSINSWLLTKKE